VDRKWLADWEASMRGNLSRLAVSFEARFGYAPGVHEIGDAATEAELAGLVAAHGEDLPDDLLLFHQTIAEVRLPDVTHGYWIHRPPHPERTLSDGRRVIIFGSDGNRGLFALTAGSGTPVLRLSDEEEAVVFTADLRDFLVFLERETAAFG
jgi:hypothetical protein